MFEDELGRAFAQRMEQSFCEVQGISPVSLSVMQKIWFAKP